MPTYEYLCQNCGYKFEKFQNINEKELKICPKCNRDSLKRIIGKGGGIIFSTKDSSIYKTFQERRTCCGRDEPCDRPPCADDGICKR